MSNASTTGARPARHVLLLDRDPGSRTQLVGRLSGSGYGVIAVETAAELQETAERVRPDLILLDWDEAGVSPTGLVASLRRPTGREGPRLLLMSATSGEPQVLAGFEAGADDFIAKPYSLAEIMARVRALLRGLRHPEDEGQVLRFQELQVCGHDFRLTIRGQPVALRGSEFRLLQFLVRNPERAFTRAQLLDRVWGRDARAEERAIDVTIQRLRKALARHHCDHYVQTVRGVGYRISAAPVSPNSMEPA